MRKPAVLAGLAATALLIAGGSAAAFASAGTPTPAPPQTSTSTPADTAPEANEAAEGPEDQETNDDKGQADTDKETQDD
ncbi:hypothetical protein [Herbidospora sp. RD11066]